MKMKKSALLRLKALLAITAANLTAEESAELQNLTKAAQAAKVDTKALDAAIEAATEEGDGEMTEEDLKEVVQKSVSAAMAAHKSASPEDIEEHVTKALAKANVTEDKIRAIMGDVLKEHTKSAPKIEFPVSGGVDFPCESRAGNLSVSQKQLLNVCLMKVSEDALADLGTKRPSCINDGLTDTILRKTKSANDNIIRRFKQGAKALTTGGSGSGAELVYTDLSTDLMQRLYLSSDLAQALMQREINMPTDPFKLPIKTVRTPFNVGSESPVPSQLSDYFTGNSPTLANVTLDAKKLIGFASYSYESNEDSVIAILPMLQQDLGEGAAAAFESAILNGDADGTHQDTAKSYTATSPESMYNGIRKAAVASGVVADWSSAGATAENFMALRAAMGKWGVNPNDCAILVSPFGYSALQAIPEAFRYDSRGNPSLSAVNTGTLASFNGMRVIVSEHLGRVASTGLATAETYEQLLITNLTQWLVGVRRGFTVEVTSDPIVQSNYVVASFRRAFTQKDTASATVPHTVMGTKWTTFS